MGENAREEREGFVEGHSSLPVQKICTANGITRAAAANGITRAAAANGCSSLSCICQVACTLPWRPSASCGCGACRDVDGFGAWIIEAA